METKERRENDMRKMGLLVPLLSSLGPFVPKKKNSYVHLKTHIAQRAALLFQPPKQTTIKGEEAGNSSSMSFMSGWNKTTLINLSRLKNRSCLGSGSSSKSRPSPSPSPSPSPWPSPSPSRSTTEPQRKPSGLLIRRGYRINNWIESELDALWLGVRRHGEGNWKAIIADSRLFPASLGHKTPQELSIMWNKDKLKLFPSRLLVSPPPSSSVPVTNTRQGLQPQPQQPPPPPPSALEKNKEKEVINDRAETSILTPTQLDRVPPHMYLDYGIKRVQEKHSVKSSINFPSVVHEDDASGSGSVPSEKASSSSGLSHGVTTHDEHASAPPCQRPSSPVYGLLATIEESSSRACDGNQTALSSMKRLLPETEKEKVVISESEDDDTKPQRLLLGGQFQLSNILDQMKKNKNYAQEKKNIEAGTSSNPFHIDSD
ncbi:hypothetical protein PIB30_009641 [Stylosanthes scabra]|uniref:Uncharacterized protein n=1 Tax=Stylosanthes scabra TaxID=79078 RepID=A0ABU6T5P5_9FABA|nr:hypothetical protein [Stylosanthes scabra]